MSLSPVDPMRETSQVSMFLVLISEVLRGFHSDKSKGAQETTPEDLPARWRLTGLVFPRKPFFTTGLPRPLRESAPPGGVQRRGEELGQALSPLSWPGSPAST